MFPVKFPPKEFMEQLALAIELRPAAAPCELLATRRRVPVPSQAGTDSPFLGSVKWWALPTRNQQQWIVHQKKWIVHQQKWIFHQQQWIVHQKKWIVHQQK